MIIKKNADYWKDNRGNEWSCSRYSKQEAEYYSTTLHGSHDCTNCEYCKNCMNCTNCIDCRDCRNCTKCYDCANCYKCEFCRGCFDCKVCTNCSYCRNCIDSVNCVDCAHCRDCVDCERVCHCKKIDATLKQYQLDSLEIGSRRSQTTVYIGVDENHEITTFVICGCFKGTFQQFKDKVKETYPEKTNINRKEYDTFIRQINKFIKSKENIY